MFKRIFTFIFPLAMICTIALMSVSEAQLQPITTSVICSTPANCATANLNLEAATMRRPTTDVLGQADVGIFVMHPIRAILTLTSAPTWRSGDSRCSAPTVSLAAVSLSTTAMSSMLPVFDRR